MSGQNGLVSSLDLVPSILDSADLATNMGFPASRSSAHRTGANRQKGYLPTSETGENEHEETRRFAARGPDVEAHIERDIESSDILDETAYKMDLDPDERNPQDPTEIGVGKVAEKLRGFSEPRLRSEDRGPTENVARADSDKIDERLEALEYK